MTAEIDYEVEYNNRARVPDHPALIAGWARDAKAWRESRANLFHTISYGPGVRNTIDVFPSRNEGAMVVFIHGGYWQALDGSFFSPLAAGQYSHAASAWRYRAMICARRFQSMTLFGRCGWQRANWRGSGGASWSADIRPEGTSRPA